MSTSGHAEDPRAVGVCVDDGELSVEFADGRRLVTPLSWFPRLVGADREQRRNWRFVAEGRGIHWPDVDEDVSIRGLLRDLGGPGRSNRAS